MAPDPQGETALRRLLRQLRQRKMVQWAVAYGAGAWLLLQIIDIIGPRWGLTDGHSRTLDVVLIVGFAATLVLAWYHGEQGRQRVNGIELLILAALLLLGGIGLRLVEVEDGVPATATTAAPTTTGPAAGTPATSDPAPSPTLAAAPAERRRTIAVLPFDNFSPNADDAYFAAGITEEITGQLARIGDLTVLSRTAVERALENAEESGASLEDLANGLGAGAVLEGSVRMAGPRVRITAQLIDVASQRNLWSDNFDRELTDIFQIQTEVALAIGDALLAELSSGERRRLETAATDSIPAYQLFLRQQELHGNDPEANREAMALLEQALALDPGYAEAWARLSWRYTWISRLDGDQPAAERAEQLALKALETDPQLAMAHYALASALGELERIEEQGAAFARAIELDPGFESVLADGSFYYGTEGQPAEGVDLAFRAVRVAPNDPNTRWHAYVPLLFLGDFERTDAWLRLARDEGMEYHRLASAEAYVALFRGRPEHAATLARAMVARFPDSFEARLLARQVLFLAGNIDEVAETIVARGQDAPDSWALSQLAPRTERTLMGYVLAWQGEDEAAQRAFDEVLAAAETAVAGGSTYQGRALDVASVHAMRGDAEAALEALERSYQLGFRGDFMLAVDPFFASLRGNPRFQALLERMADSQREQREIALRTGALDGYDGLIAAAAARLEAPQNP